MAASHGCIGRSASALVRAEGVVSEGVGFGPTTTRQRPSGFQDRQANCLGTWDNVAIRGNLGTYSAGYAAGRKAASAERPVIRRMGSGRLHMELRMEFVRAGG